MKTKPGTGVPESFTLPTRKLIEGDAFPIEFISALAEAESWRKEINRPIYHVHKWWAKRLGSVFRSLVLGCALPPEARLEDEFYRQHDFSGLVVFDPFMGSGTTVGEAHKLGCTALGRDINPVAYEAVRVAFGPLDRDKLLSAFSRLSATVGEKIREHYRATDAQGNDCDVLYYFWVKTLPCPACRKPVDLFPNYVFARNAYPDRKPEVRACCPQCGDIFTALATDERLCCPSCRHKFGSDEGPAKGTTAACPHCSHGFSIAKAASGLGHPPIHRLYAKLVLTQNDEKIYLPATAKDVERYAACERLLVEKPLPLPTLALEDGHNTKQALNYGYRTWRDFFNGRQLLALGWLHDAIVKLNEEPAVRDALLIVFSGCLEFNNQFASYKGEGTGAIRHMFAHHILKPERMPIEGNVWGTSRSSGAFSTLFKSRLLRAIEYRQAPFELQLHRNGKGAETRKVFGASQCIAGRIAPDWPASRSMKERTIYLSCGDSSVTGLADTSVDLVITDPPFFDNVHYSELADFFYAWHSLRPGWNGASSQTSRQAEEVQDTDADLFARKLQAVFQEAHRVLKPDGLLVFTYHHSKQDGWTSLAEAVLEAGFVFYNSHPVKAEMSGAAPKAQAKEPIQLDVVLVCRKRSADDRKRQNTANAFTAAVNRSRSKLGRLGSLRPNLSANDRRVALFSQFLVEASAGRDAHALLNELNSALTDLEVAAQGLVDVMPLAESRSAYPPAQVDQLVLLDRPFTDAGHSPPPSTLAATPAPENSNGARRKAAPQKRKQGCIELNWPASGGVPVPLGDNLQSDADCSTSSN